MLQCMLTSLKVKASRPGQWLAKHEILLVAGIVPILVIAPSPALPSWLVAGAMCIVPLSFIARHLAYGRATVATPQELPLLFLLVMLTVGTIITIDMTLTILVVKRMLLALAIFFYLVNNIRSQTHVALGAAALVGAGVLMGAAGLLGTNWSTGKVQLLEEAYRRLPHVVSAGLNAAGFNANIVGGTLAMIVPVAIGLTAATKERWRVVSLLATLFILTVVVLSQSRGALFGLAAALGIMAVLADRRFAILLLMAFCGLAVAWLQLGTPVVVSLLLGMEGAGGTVESRIELWQRALYMIQDFSYTGIGSGTFSRVLPVLYPPFLSPPDAVIPHAHQMYLQAAVDFGIPGFVAFVALLTTLFLIGIDIVRATKPAVRLLSSGLFAGFIVYLVHGLIDDVTFSTKAAAVLWTIAGLMVGQWRLLHTSPAAPERAGPQGPM